MYAQVFLLVICTFNCVVFLSNAEKSLQLDGKIVGGQIVNAADYPYIVQLYVNQRFICAGSLIEPKIVLTAAHCIFNRDVTRYSVMSGNNKQRVNIWKFVLHPKYSMFTIDYDVAGIFLTEALGAENQPISFLNANLPDGTTLDVTGWGRTNERNFTYSALQLRNAKVNVFNHAECRKRYWNRITNRMLCGAAPGRDACQGDSGGPLTMGNKLVGIVSWGLGCAREGYPGVYTNVTNSEIQNFIKSLKLQN